MTPKHLKHLLAPIAASSLVVLRAGGAEAATSTVGLEVNVAIPPRCTISSTSLAFGAYDPLVANASSPLQGTGGLSVICTLGSAATVLLGHGDNPSGSSTDSAPMRRMSDGHEHYLSYFLYSNPSRTALWGNAAEVGAVHIGTGARAQLTVYGVVPGGQTVPAGAYRDAVIATVTF